MTSLLFLISHNLNSSPSLYIFDSFHLYAKSVGLFLYLTSPFSVFNLFSLCTICSIHFSMYHFFYLTSPLSVFSLFSLCTIFQSHSLCTAYSTSVPFFQSISLFITLCTICSIHFSSSLSS